MINKINNTYDIFVDKLYKDDSIYFFYNDSKYRIREIKDTKLNNGLNNYPNIDTLVLTKDNKETFNISNSEYALYKINNIEDVEVSYYDIELFLKETNNNKIDILTDFKNKIDTLEQQLIEFNKEYPLIKKTFNYYVGMSENAISLLSSYDSEHKTYLIHNNISSFKSYKEYFNPLNISYGYKVIECSNYIKYKHDYDIDKYLKILDKEEYLLLLICLLYQNDYFELITNIIKTRSNEDKLEEFNNNHETYLIFIKKLYKEMNKSVKLPFITWLSR